MGKSETPQVAIVDFGLGNLFSVRNACEHVGLQANITSIKEDILGADAVILPGVGAFGDAMGALRKLDLISPLRDAAASKIPLIGICLGMQLLMRESFEFGRYEGLGLIDGAVLPLDNPFESFRRLKVPHVGWNRIYQPGGGAQASDGGFSRDGGWSGSPLAGLNKGEFMYFVHSYYAEPDPGVLALSKTRYGDVEFCSSFRKDNLFGFQFHPERSGRCGLTIYENLAGLIRESKNTLERSGADDFQGPPSVRSKRDEHLEVKYGLPEKVLFCNRCVISNQRPSSTPEFRNTIRRKIKTLQIDEEGVCDPCRYAKQKEQIDWERREKELVELCDRFRRTDGSYDCLVPGSGGKDSAYAAHILKYKYGMNPLTCTWAPIIYTDIGWRNFTNWLNVGGLENILFHPNGRIHRLLTRLAIENLMHPFQTFILGQKNIAPKIALRYNIPLMFYGENEAEYGNPIADNTTSLREKSFYAMENLSEIRLSGIPIKELFEKHGLTLKDVEPYLPVDERELVKFPMEVHYLGYYLKWTPQEAYYYAVENTGFQANPFRTEGTYSKYNSLDDRIDGLHYYTTFIKFGIGRATYDASQEIRNRHITREEGVALVHRFEGEFPEKYFQEIMDYLEMKPEKFLRLCDQSRSPHLWKHEGGDWKLRYQVS